MVRNFIQRLFVIETGPMDQKVRNILAAKLGRLSGRMTDCNSAQIFCFCFLSGENFGRLKVLGTINHDVVTFSVNNLYQYDQRFWSEKALNLKIFMTVTSRGRDGKIFKKTTWTMPIFFQNEWQHIWIFGSFERTSYQAITSVGSKNQILT